MEEQIELALLEVALRKSREALCLQVSLTMRSLAAAIRTILSGSVSSLSHQGCPTGTGLRVPFHKELLGTRMPLLPLSLWFELRRKRASRTAGGLSLAMGALATAIRTIPFRTMASEPHQRRSAQADICVRSG